MPSKAHIKKLPAEILSDIFRQCLPPSTSSDNHIPSVQTAPLLIMQVCKTWRQVAESDPLLWTSLSLQDHTLLPSASKIERQTMFTEAWFSRAKQLPLSLSITFSFDAGDYLLETSMLPYLPRIEKLALYMPLSCYIVFSRLPENAAPILEEIHFRSLVTHNQTDHFDFSFKTFLRLRRLILNCKIYGFIYHSIAVETPWMQLTTLELFEPHITQAEGQAILMKCTNIFKCRMTLCSPTGSSPGVFSRTAVVLHQLRNLALRYSGQIGSDDGMTLFFAPFSFPLLNTLTLRITTAGSRVKAAPLVGLQARSAFMLESLSITTPYIGREDLFALLRAMPTITTFHLNFMAYDYNTDLPLYTDIMQLIANPVTSLLNNVLPSLTCFVMSITILMLPERQVNIGRDSYPLVQRVPTKFIEAYFRVQHGRRAWSPPIFTVITQSDMPSDWGYHDVVSCLDELWDHSSNAEFSARDVLLLQHTE